MTTSKKTIKSAVLILTAFAIIASIIYKEAIIHKYKNIVADYKIVSTYKPENWDYPALAKLRNGNYSFVKFWCQNDNYISQHIVTDEFKKAQDFEFGLAKVTDLNGNTFVINTDGYKVYDDVNIDLIYKIQKLEPNFIRVAKVINGKKLWGFVKTLSSNSVYNGRFDIAPKYIELSPFMENDSVACGKKLDGTHEHINSKGEKVAISH